MSNVHHRLSGLYVITDGQSRSLQVLIDRARAVLDGGARVLQYRDKTDDAPRRLREALALCGLCRDAGALFIVNDDSRLAAACGADGVHLGRDDGAIDQARGLLGPEALIGVSCYNSLERAEALQRAGASYLAFGAVYPSPTKPGAIQVSMDTLREARQRFKLPLVAIGGITAENAAPLAALGLDALAVISAVFSAAEPATAARRICQVMQAAREYQ
ncbi:thiamine-phosphate pyrophosphorylase [Natronocella acetinitrilica]|uniref:Thiamine-phosphate synthase n=1 Tax=Natronocella acetinitrilica TaxID=414046 RepID=A0AAE3G3G2_9GAMM|nr:thiamine phosphate synthase [Natronocella acetinitrilica]MCP1675100.1 thiamine-phosphate pyrophosphorylase [Natronocella acetinitrilica]